MKKLTGIPASSGIVFGRAFLYLEDNFPEIPRNTIGKDQVGGERRRLLGAIEEAARELKALNDRAVREMSKEQAAIFETHLMMMEDDDFTDQILKRLETDLINAEWAVRKISDDLIRKLAASTDSYLRERAADISDVSGRILTKLLSITKFSLADLEEDVILVVHDLLPSEALAMNKERVLGLVMDMGSRTSHTAILARAFEIPAVLGLSTATREIKTGDLLVVNGADGVVLINPDEKNLFQYEQAIHQYHAMFDGLLAQTALPAETTDGCRFRIKANIETPGESEQARRFGAEGIGLYRSEFLFLNPEEVADEETQFRAYSQVVKTMEGRPVTIRTLDVGGDKLLPEFQSADEKNPLLGWRAIRFCLSLPELFKTQLRAILRASVYGNVAIMFPMISGIEELEQALDILEEAKGECRRRGQAYAPDIKAGTMIEIPSAAMTADILAEKSDFFSIGTNDLIQYTLAVDRGNERVSYLAQPTHPAVLRLLKGIIDTAHEKGIPVAMCGELAGDTAATALLLGLGLDEFSMTAASIPLVKRIIRGAALENCRALTEEALQCSSYHQVSALVEAWMNRFFPDD
ncbi:MAG: phosphoenolpyruvate--protein phosphotransferase [Spirochaetaceae bacterium]|jgi:phosphotransferase system enzyme I (PtsI)|nr:phosphoenolpyruvate--protein phosphotransferase [Spirochaetaceae bacterium]